MQMRQKRINYTTPPGMQQTLCTCFIYRTVFESDELSRKTDRAV